MNDHSRAFLFGLTLTELMILVVFLLALLIGVGQEERQTAEVQLQAAAMAERAALAARDAATAELDALEKRVANQHASQRQLIDLRARLEQLERERAEEPRSVATVRALLESADPTSTRALESLLDELRRQLDTPSTTEPGLAEHIDRLLSINGEALDRCESQRTTTQAALERSRVEHTSCLARIDYLRRAAGKGASWPPCWPSTDPARPGKQDYLFDIEMQAGGYRIRPAWPASRESDARALPQALALIGRTVSPEEFTQATRAIYDESVRANCRHFVHVGDRLANDKALYKTRLERVERHFYKHLR